MGGVVKFNPQVVGEDYRFDPDEILTKAMGQDFATLIICGEREDGTIDIRSNANAGEALILMEKAKRQVIFGGE